jgi:hypothetical protein
MINANRQAPFALFVLRRILIAGGAGLLILAGLVLQLGALGYGHVQPSNVWIASTVAQGVWSMLILQLDAGGVHAAATYWPLFLISMGLAILLLTRRETAPSVPSRSQGRQTHAR